MIQRNHSTKGSAKLNSFLSTWKRHGNQRHRRTSHKKNRAMEQGTATARNAIPGDTRHTNEGR